MTLAMFRTAGNGSVEKVKPKISLDCSETTFFSSFKIFTGILFEPYDLSVSREVFIKDI